MYLHTYRFLGKALGHMSDQTVVWVCCPTARRGHCVTKRQEKGEGKCGDHRSANASDLRALTQTGMNPDTHTRTYV